MFIALFSISVVVNVSGIHNVGFYDERLPSSGHSNNNKRFSGKFGQCFSLGGRVFKVYATSSLLFKAYSCDIYIKISPRSHVRRAL